MSGIIGASPPLAGLPMRPRSTGREGTRLRLASSLAAGFASGAGDGRDWTTGSPLRTYAASPTGTSTICCAMHCPAMAKPVKHLKTLIDITINMFGTFHKLR